MALPGLENFISKPQQFEGIYEAGNALERNNLRQEELLQKKEARQAATNQFLTNYLDKKDYLTGSPYDPLVVSQLQEALNEGTQLAAKGADTSSILMALGPKISKLNQYSAKSKLIDQQVKNSVSRLKGYKGYNTEALEQEAKRSAYFDDKGQLKDISSVDPTTDWVGLTLEQKPEAVTSWAGLDDFVDKTPMQEVSKDITTIPAPGRTLQNKYHMKFPFWVDIQKDEKGNIAFDPLTGKPLGLSVVSDGVITDDKGQPMINPETKQPFKILEKQRYDAIVNHNRDIRDAVRAEVARTFKQLNKPVPPENSPQWEAMARSVLHDELAIRNRTSFAEVVNPTESNYATKLQMVQDPTTAALMRRLANLDDNGSGGANGNSLKSYKVNAVGAIGKIFNGDPEYLSGEKVKVGGREVVDVTSVFPGGGLKDGRGEDYKFKSIYFDPVKRELIAEREISQDGFKNKENKVIPESQVGQFIRQISEANGIPLPAVRKLLDDMGYKNGKFQNAVTQQEPNSSQQTTKTPSVLSNLANKVKGFFVGSGSSKPAEKKQQQQPADVYTRQELLSNGWTEQQINQAVKLGKIKVK